jgi:hypothetical protein
MTMNAHPGDDAASSAAGLTELVATRRTLHGIAEHIVSAHGWRSGADIRLFVTMRGFETRPTGADVLALADGVLERRPSDPSTPLTAVPLADAATLGALADGVGVPFGMPDPPYKPASGSGPDDPVSVDMAALATLVDGWARGAQALRIVAARHELEEQEPPLWPEHFDVGLAVGEVNLGVSPGDDVCPEPYAYVGPWTAREGAFWNAPFGALQELSTLPDVDALVDYFELGLRTAADDSVRR